MTEGLRSLRSMAVACLTIACACAAGCASTQSAESLGRFDHASDLATYRIVRVGVWMPSAY